MTLGQSCSLPILYIAGDVAPTQSATLAISLLLEVGHNKWSESKEIYWKIEILEVSIYSSMFIANDSVPQYSTYSDYLALRRELETLSLNLRTLHDPPEKLPF